MVFTTLKNGNMKNNDKDEVGEIAFTSSSSFYILARKDEDVRYSQETGNHYNKRLASKQPSFHARLHILINGDKYILF